MHFKLDFNKREREHSGPAVTPGAVIFVRFVFVLWNGEMSRCDAVLGTQTEQKEIDRQTERVTQFLSLMLFVVVNRTFLTLIDHENWLDLLHLVLDYNAA